MAYNTGVHRIGVLVMVILAVMSTAGVAAPVELIDVKTTLAGIVMADDLVKVGDRIEDGQPLVYVQTALTGSKSIAARAPREGVVREVLVRPGQRVERGDVVVRLEPR